jgi:O-antigen/teichoic acid export membrane protein
LSTEVEEDIPMQQHKPLTLRRNFSWSFVGNFVYAACLWGMLVVLSKLGSPEIVGQFTLGLAVTTPVLMFTNLELQVIQATDAKHQYNFSDYLGLRIISTGVALLAIAVITWVAEFSWESSLVVLLVGLAKGIEAISDVFHGLLQKYEQMDRIAISKILKGPLSLFLLGIGVYLSGSLVWGVVGLIFAWAVILASYDLHSGVLMLAPPQSTLQRKRLKWRELAVILQPRWHLATLIELIWLTLPLGLGMMLITLNINMPRYFIDWYMGERQLGIFAAIAYIMVAGNIVVTALGNSAVPRLAKYYAAGNKSAFRTLLLKLLGISVLLGSTAILVALVAGRQILTLLYQPEYARHTDLLVWIMVAAGIGYMGNFLLDAMIATRYLRIQIPLFALVTTVSASYWLIPILGLQGAAIALLIAKVIQILMSLGVIIYALHKLPSHAENPWQHSEQKL